MSADIDQALLKLGTRIVGLRSWQAALGHGSFVTIDLGGRRLNSLGREVGDFVIWVYGGQWVIRGAGDLLGCDDDGRSRMAVAASTLRGRTVQSIDIDKSTTRLRICFDEALELVVEPRSEDEMEDWLIFTDEGMVLTAEQGALKFGSASRP